uniref:Uncharacterized protein n=1 Tax=Oryza barthii TaxID=65489 RepID=A0A0D3GFC5_9ORYZ
MGAATDDCRGLWSSNDDDHRARERHPLHADGITRPLAKKKPFLRAVGLPTYENFNFHTPNSWRCYTTNENIFLPFVINTVM